jgi:hypothetical protein
MKSINPYRVGLAVAALAAAVIGTVTASTEQAQAVEPHRTLPLCASDEGESDYPCVWVAFAQGNGRGHSFRIYRDGRVKQITDRRAFELAGDCDSNGPLYCRSGNLNVTMTSDRYGQWSQDGEHGQYVAGGWS